MKDFLENNIQDDTEAKSSPTRSWLERLSQVLLREPQDREQLVELLRDAEQRDLLDSQALAMIEGVLQISLMQVRDIMVPRPQMIVIDEDSHPKEFIKKIIDSGHSRFPVLNDASDTVIGILLAKDLLAVNFQQDNSTFNLREILRPAVFVPESKRLDKLLHEFRVNRNHMAIVVDEYGSISGLVTIEDVLEQIVGEIEDEYDIDDEAFIKQLSDTQYSVKAWMPIEEFNQYFSSHLDEKEFDTIGGLVMHAFGHLPKRGERVSLSKFRFKVLHADHRRLRLLLLTVPKKGVEVER